MVCIHLVTCKMHSYILCYICVLTCRWNMCVESCSPIVNEVWSWCERFCPRNSRSPARKSPPSWGDAARYSRRLSVTRSSRWVYSYTNSGTDPLLVMSPVWFPGLITLVQFWLLTVRENRRRTPDPPYHVNDITIDRRGGAPKLKEHILCTHCSSGTSIMFSTSQMFVNVPPVLGQILQEMAILSAEGTPPLP